MAVICIVIEISPGSIIPNKKKIDFMKSYNILFSLYNKGFYNG